MELTDEIKSPKDAYALIVGISKYQDSAITPLRFTRADAEAFGELLTDAKVCGVPKGNVKLLLDEQATKFDILDAIGRWMADSAGPESTTIIFYAGHGDVEPDRTGAAADAIANYLLPYDARSTNLSASALSKEAFQREVRKVRSKRNVILMDACHAGGVATTGSRKMSVGYSRDLYSSLAEGAGSTVIAAAAPNQLSWEDEKIGHGVFTYHLLEALKGAADSDQDGRITMTEVFDYLKRKVPESARRLGGADQNPVFKADLSEDIVLTINPERIARMAEEEQEKRQRERERVRALREKLFEFEREADVPARAHNLVNELIEKRPEDLDPDERGIVETMGAMAAGHVSVDTFVRQCDLYLNARPTEPRQAQPEKVAPSSVSMPPEATVSAPVADGGPEEVQGKVVSPGLNLVMILASLFFPIVGLIGGVIYLAKSAREEKRAGKRWILCGVIGFFGWLFLGGCLAMIEQMNSPYMY